MFLPMLGACFVAMLLAMLLRNPPIYDPLREHTLPWSGKSHSDERDAIRRTTSAPPGKTLGRAGSQNSPQAAPVTIATLQSAKKASPF